MEPTIQILKGIIRRTEEQIRVNDLKIDQLEQNSEQQKILMGKAIGYLEIVQLLKQDLEHFENHLEFKK